MGQYYCAFLWDKETGERFLIKPSALKLMEHSYFKNEDVDIVVRSLTSYPKCVWWVGDFANSSDFHLKPSVPHPMCVWKMGEEFNKLEYLSDNPKKFLVNYSKNEYINLEEYENEQHSAYKIHPLPLLTAVGNGKGSGDYSGLHDNLVGQWAGDMIGCVDVIPENFKDVTNYYVFKEDD